MKSKKLAAYFKLIFTMSFAFASVWAGDWPSWRGPNQNGVTEAEGLVSDWSLDGKNLIWRVDFVGRSTPIVLDGRVCATGRVGDGIDKQELVACYDAETGRLLWERRFNVFLTSIPFPRVGWASLVGDPSTGNVYFHGVGGLFACLDPQGKTVWELSLYEEFGRYSGYGGRVDTPVVDGDLVLLAFANSSWGDQAVPRHRFFAFDKLTGEIVWTSTPGGPALDLSTFSTPVIVEIEGQRLLIAGGGDGLVHALKVNTGEKVWSFKLSLRGINAAVVVEDGKVYASHSEENPDEATMGRVVAIDGTGKGDVTESNELWRHNAFPAGFPSPTIDQGKLFVVDNSANLHVLDTKTGDLLWEFSLGTVGKASPVIADGKLIVPEINGALHIIDISGGQYRPLSRVEIPLGQRFAEIYGSPAIAYDRIYLATEEGLYCIGDKSRPFKAEPSPRGPAPERGSEPAVLQLIPADLSLMAGEKKQFRLRAVDQMGRLVGEVTPDSWDLQGISGEVGGDGVFTAGNPQTSQAGMIQVRAGQLEAKARVRIYPSLPWTEDFENLGEKQPFPTAWIGGFSRFSPEAVPEGGIALKKPRTERGIQRSYMMIGPPDMSAYEIQADVKGSRDRRRVPDVGILNQRYCLALEGGIQKLSVHSWPSENRMRQEMDFPWEMDVWYTMKMRVDIEGGKAVILGKVWRRDSPEPSEWTFRAEDPHPNLEGSPGIFGQSYTDLFIDNIKVVSTKQ